MRILYLYVLLVTLLPNRAISQIDAEGSVRLSGTVVDESSQIPLEYAMVVVTDVRNPASFAHVQTDTHGRFSLSLDPKRDVRLEVFYLGYADYGTSLPGLTGDTTVTVSLVALDNQLSEVVVRDTLPPISYREDTVVYNARAFYTGRERKLGELIDRMPGLEVNDDNSITYRGEPVSTLLVEDKAFFGGNSNLALTGLPADAVGRIEVLEDYQPLGYKLDPNAERKIALNVLLREDKRNVYFGEATGGAGPPDYYSLRLDAFNYNRAYNLYALGGGNNTNQELLSFAQTAQLLGGPLGITDDDLTTIFDLARQLERPPYVRQSRGSFAAVGSDFTVAKRLDLHLHGIVSDQKYATLTNNLSRFEPTPDTRIVEEERIDRAVSATAYALQADAKLNLKGQQTLLASARLHGVFSRQGAQQIYRSNFGDRDSRSETHYQEQGFEFAAEYVKRSSAGHVHVIRGSAERRITNDSLSLLSDRPFLENLLGWPGGTDTFSLQQGLQDRNFTWRLKDTYTYRFGPRLNLNSQIRIGGSNHLFHLRGDESGSELRTFLRDEQALRLTLTATPGRWKINTGVAIVRNGWGVRDTQLYAKTFQLLPQARAERTFSGFGRIKFEFQSSLRPLPIQAFYPGRRILNFTTVQTASLSLRPYAVHTLSLGYDRDYPLKDFYWGIDLNRSRTAASPINSILRVTGNNREVSYTQRRSSVRNTQVHLYFTRGFATTTWKLDTRWIITDDYTFLVGGERAPTTRNILLVRPEVKVQTGNTGSVKLSSQLTRQLLRGGTIRNEIYTLTTEAQYTARWGNFSLRPAAELSLFDFSASPTRYAAVRLTADYQFPKSPWRLGLTAAAPLGGRQVRSFEQTELFYQESTFMVFPAFVVGTVNYAF
ncbi:carboxypeptidase regulatory-like domain-containing protein [Lewinella sp. IMCC34183]|uniref:carboxypeptidase regulatory-like domain-containing protein n=1 Tax=Lewinella sp. IMCC34183 TaxID=2248762 RepID=UPI00130055C8|nr:carboxypeptidase-like regulatory domain-containing protein [Lewinella sp. IMCC34183]